MPGVRAPHKHAASTKPESFEGSPRLYKEVRYKGRGGRGQKGKRIDDVSATRAEATLHLVTAFAQRLIRARTRTPPPFTARMKKLFARDKPKPTRVAPGSRDIDVRPAPAPHRAARAADSHHQPDHAPAPPPHPYLPPEPVHRRPPRPSNEEENWEVVRQSQLLDEFTSPHAPALAPSRQSSHGSLPPGASPPVASPRSPSPYSVRSLQGAISMVSPPPVGSKEPPRDTTKIRKQPQAHGGAITNTLRALDPPSLERDEVTTQSEHSPSAPMPKEPEKKRGFWQPNLFGDRTKDSKREDDGELTRMIGAQTTLLFRSLLI